jgi:hypothetical protein
VEPDTDFRANVCGLGTGYKISFTQDRLLEKADTATDQNTNRDMRRQNRVNCKEPRGDPNAKPLVVDCFNIARPGPKGEGTGDDVKLCPKPKLYVRLELFDVDVGEDKLVQADKAKKRVKGSDGANPDADLTVFYSDSGYDIGLPGLLAKFEDNVLDKPTECHNVGAFSDLSKEPGFACFSTDKNGAKDVWCWPARDEPCMFCVFRTATVLDPALLTSLFVDTLDPQVAKGWSPTSYDTIKAIKLTSSDVKASDSQSTR